MYHSNKDDEELTEFEQWQEEAMQDYKIVRSKAKHKQKQQIEDPLSSYQLNRSRASVDGLRSDNDKLKASYNMKIDEDFDIQEYLDIKIDQNTHMTNSIKSTLNSLKSKINKKTIISEKNSSGEKNEK